MPTKISTTKPVDVEVRCDSCSSSIDDGAILTWNPLAAAIECAPCASREARTRRLVVATVTRSRVPETVERPEVDESCGPVEGDSAPMSDGLDEPALHVFDVQSAVADAVALVAAARLGDRSTVGGPIAGDDDDTAEIELRPVTEEGNPIEVAPVPGPEPVTEVAAVTERSSGNSPAGSTPTVFAPPAGLRSMLIPPPFPSAPSVRRAHLPSAVSMSTSVSSTVGTGSAEPSNPEPVDGGVAPIASQPSVPRLPVSPHPVAPATASLPTLGNGPSAPPPSPPPAGASTADPVTLSNRRIPRIRSSIAHIVVTPTGVFLVEPCPTPGVVTVAKRMGSERVHVGGNDQDRLLRRIRSARKAAAGLLRGLGFDGIDVRCVLVVNGSHDATMTSDAIEILSPTQLDAALDRRGELGAHEVAELAQRLSDRFPRR